MNIVIAVISLLGTIAIFYACKALYQKFRKEWLTPILISPLVIILLLLVTGTSYESYNAGADILSNLLRACNRCICCTDL
ncbi:CidB/LrgB family autolysis modulator OS=Lysinibacillus sphaericus OX=1421 GN=LS41612_06465 PE=4 SV=1 [Lysinibacillus sphaericus]